MTLGEYRVGIEFNPSSNVQVREIKRLAARLIDYINELDIAIPTGETLRLQAHAMTLVEDAAMNAVKAATKKPMPTEITP